MEIYLPLRAKGEEGRQLRLAAESNCLAFTSADTRITENGADLVCVCEGTSTSLYCLVNSELISLGTFFFRRREGEQVFSVLEGGNVKDFSQDEVAQLARAGSSSAEIQLSADCHSRFVGFAEDVLLIGTEAGYLGMVFVNKERTQVRGKSVHLHGNHTSHWCISAKISAWVSLSEGVVSIATVKNDVSDVRSYSGASDAIDIGAIAACTFDDGETQCLFVTHTNSYNLTVLRCSSPDHVLKSDAYTLVLAGDGNDASAESIASNLYAYEWDTVTVLAAVYSDTISFTSWSGATLRSSAAIKNELTTPFGPAFWKGTSDGCRLYVLRSDALCLLYDVVMNFDACAIQEVVVTGQVALPSAVSCRLGSADSGKFLCWRTGALLSRNTALMQSALEESTFEVVEIRGSRSGALPSTAAVLLLEVVPIRKSYGIVCLCSNGECHLSLYGERGTVRIAHEDHPHDATSCLAYEEQGRAYACVLGFNDGDIRVFVNGVLRSWVRVAHCGVVNKLLRLPKMNEADDTSFVSISTEMGTVCFHAGENAAVSRTMSSPSRPLTSCLLDRALEYIFLFSDSTGNLWHLPTCRLERAFRSRRSVLDQHFDDLLEYHWASATKVFKFSFAGSQHYAVNVNVDLLVSIFEAGQPQQQSPSQEYVSALSLILRCLGESCSAVVPKVDDFGEALEDVGLLVAEVQTHECIWCAILMLCELLSRTPDPVSAAAIFTTVQSLNTKLLACDTQDPRRQADVLQQFLSRFFTLNRSTPASLRYALRTLIAKSPVDSIQAVMHALKVCSSAAPMNTITEGSSLPTDDALRRERALSALLIVASVATQQTGYKVEDDAELSDFLRRAAAEALQSVLAALQDDHALLFKSALFLALVESYTVLRVVCSSDQVQLFVRTLVKEAFSGKNEEVRQASLEALERLVGHASPELLSAVIAPVFQGNPVYRPYIAVFLAHLVKNFPYEAYSNFGAIADILMTGLNDATATTREESSLFNVSVGQLLRLAVASLPNVSLQPSQHHLAVGSHDGKVVVYNIKAATLVTSFQAHQAPVLGVAYSGNIATLDIATIAEPMNEIRVWRSVSQASSIASFFGGGGGTSFKLVSSVEVPAAGVSVANAPVLIKYFRLRWLSPQCLEFASPWHGKIQVSLP